MFLSNSRHFLPFIFVLTSIFQACSAAAVRENGPSALPPAKTSLPFSTAEPETYQAIFAFSNGVTEQQWFVARKGSLSRFDVYRGGRAITTELRGDGLVRIDHQSRTYAAGPASGGEVADPPVNFFRAKQYRKFEDLGTSDGIHKFRAFERETDKEAAVISIDTATGLIVKQEFPASDGMSYPLVFEARDLKVTVDDSLFAVPEGYQKLSWSEFRKHSP